MNFEQKLTEMQLGIIELGHEIVKIRRDIAELNDNTRVEVEKQLGDKVKMIDGALTEVILQKEVLIEKGFVSREELNQKYEKVKNG